MGRSHLHGQVVKAYAWSVVNLVFAPRLCKSGVLHIGSFVTDFRECVSELVGSVSEYCDVLR